MVGRENQKIRAMPLTLTPEQQANQLESKYPRWFYAYAMIALFNIITISTGLYINKRLIAIYGETSNVNKEWALYQEHITALSDLALVVNAPGNDVFETKQPKKEYKTYRLAYYHLIDHIGRTEKELGDYANSIGNYALVAPVLSSLSSARRSLEKLNHEVSAIFTEYKQGNIQIAASHMSVMDRHYAALARNLADASSEVRNIQEQFFEEQVRIAAKLKKIEWLMGGFMVMMIIMATWYGRVLVKRIRFNDEIQRRAALELKIIFNAVLDGIVIADSNGIIKSINKAITEKLGYSREELVGKNVSILMPQPHKYQHDGYIKQYLETGQARVIGVTREVQAWHKNGNIVPMELGITEMRVGEEVLFVGMLHDITDRLRQEQKIRHTNHQMEIFIQHTPAAIAVFDTEMRYVMVSERWKQDYNIKEDNIIGRSHYDIFPDMPGSWKEIHSRCLMGERKYCEEDRFDRADGTTEWIKWEILPWYEDGMVGGIIIFTELITEHKKFKEILEREHTRLSNIIEATEVGTWEWYVPSGEVVLNDRWAEILGYTLEEISPATVHTWAQLMHPEDLEVSDSALKCHFEGKTSIYEVECRMKHKDGRWVWILDRGKVLEWNKNGQPIIMTGTHLDITERKEAEENLRQAKIKAEEATRLKSEFLANMSHEIRTPMNGIIGMTNLLLDTDLDEVQAQYAETVAISADNLLQLINDILDFSKIEAGKLELEIIPFDMERLVKEVGDLIAIKAQEKGVEVLLRYAPGTPRFVIGDPGRIRQIFLNLASNALKFTETGHILISVETKKVKDGYVTFYATTEDTGIGIPGDKLDYIFNKFHQADNSTTRKFGGTGLGLSICKELVAMMGGELGVQSIMEVGSIFWFTLHLAIDSEHINREPLNLHHDLTGVKALVVDDNRVARQIAVEQMESCYMHVDEVASPVEALKKLKEVAQTGKPYDFALLDFMMPEMDGIQLAAAIKADKVIKETSLLLISSGSTCGDRKLLQEQGFSGFLLKPVNSTDITKAISAIWTARQTNTQIPLVTQYTLRESQGRKAHHERKNLRFDGMQILLAEDNTINQMVATTMLEKYGCHVTPAGNGKEAVRLIKQRRFHLIFMDCQMPEMDGYEATQKIRQLEKQSNYNRTSIVAFTANAMKGDNQKCLDAGMDDYIAKPVKQEDLEEMLVKWLYPLIADNDLGTASSPPQGQRWNTSGL